MMKPIGLLMIEHRLIERMVDPIQKKVRLMNEAGAVDPLFVGTMVDFSKKRGQNYFISLFLNDLN